MPRLALALLLLAAAYPAAAREISGQAGYLQRIALDPGAQIVVQLAGPEGLVGEFREETGGRQVPLSFTVQTTDTGPLFLRAALLVGGTPQWVSGPVAVPAGDEALDLGTIRLDPFVPMGFSSLLRCGDTLVEVGFGEDLARMRIGSTIHSLPLAVSASGARFSDGGTPATELWTKGDMALVTVAGVELPECRAAAMPSPLPFIARGNEPGWLLNVSTEGMVLARQDGSELRSPLPPPDEGAEGTTLATEGLVVTVTPQICRNTMTGMPHPLSVALRIGDEILQGCGGNPLDLLQGAWRVTGIEGAPLPPEAEVTMTVSGEQMFGKSACNRYTAGVTLTGEALSVLPGGMTMMACDEASMTIERQFIDMLQKVTGFDSEDGHLILKAGDRPIASAVPTL